MKCCSDDLEDGHGRTAADSTQLHATVPVARHDIRPTADAINSSSAMSSGVWRGMAMLAWAITCACSSTTRRRTANVGCPGMGILHEGLSGDRVCFSASSAILYVLSRSRGDAQLGRAVASLESCLCTESGLCSEWRAPCSRQVLCSYPRQVFSALVMHERHTQAGTAQKLFHASSTPQAPQC